MSHIVPPEAQNAVLKTLPIFSPEVRQTFVQRRKMFVNLWFFSKNMFAKNYPLDKQKAAFITSQKNFAIRPKLFRAMSLNSQKTIVFWEKKRFPQRPSTRQAEGMFSLTHRIFLAQNTKVVINFDLFRKSTISQKPNCEQVECTFQYLPKILAFRPKSSCSKTKLNYKFSTYSRKPFHQNDPLDR